jgi:hypothetical protein
MSTKNIRSITKCRPIFKDIENRILTWTVQKKITVKFDRDPK